MPSVKATILCTGPVEEPLEKFPELANAEIDVVPFTAITYQLNDTIKQKVKTALTKKAAVVFTSSNAIRSIASYLENNKPDWIIYCIGNTTYQLAKKYFGAENIRQTASNAKALAEKIIPELDGKEQEVIFFCGNLRRNDLPDALRKRNIPVNEIIVYQTSLTPVATGKEYDAILFFSPNAAESFFSVNKLPAKTVLFVMGHTTAVAIQKHSNNKIITGEEPDKYKLIGKAVQFVSENTLHH
jgi:uroporphyrinogen-III synthase